MNTMHDKTDAELHFIARDAARAAEACDGHDAVATGKYLDQHLDAISELRRRGWRPSGGGIYHVQEKLASEGVEAPGHLHLAA